MVDIGCSFGMWSYYARPYAGTIVAFEPLPPLASALAEGFRDRIQIHQVALSSESGTARITMPQLQWGYSTIEPANDLRGKVSESFGFATFDIEKRTLDSYDLRGVGFVKVDVEGHEVSVVLGARQTLERERPALIVETEERHKAGAVGEVSRIAAELGYQRFFLHGRRLHHGSEFSLAKHQDMANQRDYVRNLIFLHEPHLARLRLAKRLPFALPPQD
jgi:FkbM family methyltransferase